jgi:sec-independent protein translocase protein TatC
VSSPRELPPGHEEEPEDEVDKYRMPLLDHLRELRNRLMVSIGALGVGTLVSMAFVQEIYAVATAPVTNTLAEYGIGGGLSIVSSPFEAMTVWMHIALIGGVTLSSPVIAYQIWSFVAPGLYHTERRMVAPLAFTSTALFLGGAAFAYVVIFPIAFPFFFTVLPASVNLSLEGYLGAVLKMLVAFGLSFQLPIATFFAARLGLVDHRDLISGFRYAIVGIFVVAAVITPPDVISQVALAIPLMILYGVSIVVARIFTTKVRS